MTVRRTQLKDIRKDLYISFSHGSHVAPGREVLMHQNGPDPDTRGNTIAMTETDAKKLLAILIERYLLDALASV